MRQKTKRILLTVATSLLAMLIVGFALSWWRVRSIRIAVTQSQIAAFNMALSQYYLETGTHPTTAEGLNALVRNPGVKYWNGPYLDSTKVPEDVWGTAFRYEEKGTNMIVTSAGPDRQFGTWDDITYDKTHQKIERIL